jgi:hypothetical protein
MWPLWRLKRKWGLALKWKSRVNLLSPLYFWLATNTVWACRYIPTFWRNILPPYLGSSTLTNLHSCTTQKTSWRPWEQRALVSVKLLARLNWFKNTASRMSLWTCLMNLRVFWKARNVYTSLASVSFQEYILVSAVIMIVTCNSEGERNAIQNVGEKLYSVPLP